MTIENLILFLIKFGYIMIFGVLGITTLMLHIPKEKGIENYKKARTTIGLSLFAIVLYCAICFAFSVQRGGFIYFWLLVTFTLIHSWLTYSTMLFLLETPRYRRKHFIVDGLAPISILIITGLIGLIFPSTRNWMQIVFGCIFGLKCLYMFLVCRREYDSLFFHCAINLAGNVVLFIPIGYFLPRLWGKMRNFLRFSFTCVLSICLVELLQLLTLLGSLDIDDLILNLCGMILGYLIFMICKKKR